MRRINLSEAEYDELAREALLTALNREHAMVWPEIEAKLAERPHPRLPQGINPHILTRARQALVALGQIVQTPGVTRGGHTVDVITPTGQKGRKTAIERSAARKRLLQGRYLVWAQASAKAPNLIGEGGERVARASLRAAREAGYTPNPTGAEVTRLFGQPTPGGPFDDAAYLMAFEKEMPVALTIPIEVKNLRHWIYPHSIELYQLLDKCARIQLQHPQQRLVPVLVCRRVHFTTFVMAKNLGFAVLPMLAQPILPRAEAAPLAVREVCDELGYDLVQTDQPLDKLVREFRDSLPKIAARTALRWAEHAPALASYYSDLRSESFSPTRRLRLLDDLRDAARQLPDVEGGW